MNLTEWLARACGCSSPELESDDVDAPRLAQQTAPHDEPSPSHHEPPMPLADLPGPSRQDQSHVSFERKELEPETYQLSHRRHGRVTIQQGRKSAGSPEIAFTITLTPPSGASIEYTHRMYVQDQDNLAPGSSLGYGFIDFPDELGGIGIGYIYHRVAAAAAQELGVANLVIDSVGVDGPMERLCQGLDMTPVRGGYAFPPAAIIAAAGAKIVSRGWTR